MTSHEQRRLQVPAHLSLEHTLWTPPGSVPPTEVWLDWTPQALTCHLVCHETSPRAVHTEPNARVHRDSCLEFFLAPWPGSGLYLNLEANARGAFWAAFGSPTERDFLTPDERALVGCTPHVGEGQWSITWTLPQALFDALAARAGRARVVLAPGLEMDANFYKCGDDTPVEHYGAWAPIDAPSPDFHRPDQFGRIVLGAPAGEAGVASPVPPAVQAASPMPPAVVMDGLAKRFGHKIAVQPTMLQVPRGSFFGVVGPNGAGKTTLLRMATGLLRPDQGRAMVDGQDVWANPVEAKRRMGILPDERRMFERLSGRELLFYNGLLRGMSESVIKQRSDDLLAVLELAGDADKLVIDYSAGMHKKIALAAALLHDPRVLFLDEPLESVDPVSARTIRHVLTRLVERGATVILSSHVMETVEKLCSHVAIMAAGQIVTAGPMEQVRQGRALEDRFVELVGAPAAELERRLEWLGDSSD